MKKNGTGKTGGTNRNIRTLSRKDNPPENNPSNKRNHVADKNTYQNNNSSGLFANGQHERSNSQIPRGSQLNKPVEPTFQVISDNNRGFS